MFVARSFACLLLAVAGLTALAPEAAAAAFQVNPVRVHLEPRRAVETIVVSNDGDAALRFEASLLRWEMAADGRWVLTPSDDLVLHPQYLEVAPRSQARLRVGALDPIAPGQPQRAYRIELMQQADPGAAAGTALQILTKVSLPVFVGGAGQPQSTLRAPRFADGALAFVMGNAGGRYLPQQSAQARLLDASGRLLASPRIELGYVLAGAELPVTLPVAAAVCRDARRLELRPAEGAAIALALPTAGRRCVP